ncbi:MAG: NAD(P)H-binding protein [Betaproteobacteria bacterium]|nr:NAD(P)H-binding protein [Betaproteobacteria bacterium]
MRDSKTVLIVGLGDTGLRVARMLRGRYRVVALVRKPGRARFARRLGIEVLRGDLGRPRSLHGIAALAASVHGLRVCHLAPPPSRGRRDVHTRNLLQALDLVPRGSCRLVYVSTSGVYGDCAGDWVDESRPCRPQSDRAVRRMDAESTLLRWGRRRGARVAILRAPGIVSDQRLPLQRLQRGTPALAAAEDVYVNHIHVEDLARAMIAALRRARAGRVFNCVDDAPVRMAGYFDQVARRAGLPLPPRVSRAKAQATLPPVLYSFMRESRRLRNARMKRELGLVLRYPSVDTLLDEVFGPRSG